MWSHPGPWLKRICNRCKGIELSKSPNEEKKDNLDRGNNDNHGLYQVSNTAVAIPFITWKNAACKWFIGTIFTILFSIAGKRP